MELNPQVLFSQNKCLALVPTLCLKPTPEREHVRPPPLAKPAAGRPGGDSANTADVQNTIRPAAVGPDPEPGGCVSRLSSGFAAA